MFAQQFETLHLNIAKVHLNKQGVRAPSIHMEAAHISELQDQSSNPKLPKV